MSDMVEVQFRLTKCGRRGEHMENVELYFPGPWVSARGSRFNDLEETADSLFGCWLLQNITSYRTAGVLTVDEILEDHQ